MSGVRLACRSRVATSGVAGPTAARIASRTRPDTSGSSTADCAPCRESSTPSTAPARSGATVISISSASRPAASGPPDQETARHRPTHSTGLPRIFGSSVNPDSSPTSP